ATATATATAAGPADLDDRAGNRGVGEVCHAATGDRLVHVGVDLHEPDVRDRGGDRCAVAADGRHVHGARRSEIFFRVGRALVADAADAHAARVVVGLDAADLERSGVHETAGERAGVVP